MATTIDALRLRKRMGREFWLAPRRFGPNGWWLPNSSEPGGILVSADVTDDGIEFVHASIAYRHRLPIYSELCALHRAAFNGFAYQVFAPHRNHINIHEHALHLWGRADGAPWLPDFGAAGTI